MGEAIASWADLLDPDLVVVGGSVCAAGPVWREALEAGVEARIDPMLRGLPVVDAQLGGDTPIGAAERLLDKVGA